MSCRRVLLNKCQEEFEAGDNAMKAVDAREKAAAEKSASGEVRPAKTASRHRHFVIIMASNKEP